jgi:uncharacterized surface protein with fasciclin (FAS1) repeats
MTRRNILPLAILALALLLVAGAVAACGGSDDASASGTTASDVAAALSSDAQLSQYSDAFAAAGIGGDGPFTVFAASNDALSAAGVTLTVDDVKASVIEGEKYAPADLHGLSTDSMLEGTKVTTYQGTDGSLYVNDMKIIGDPIEAGNGIVYIYDGAIHVEE